MLLFLCNIGGIFQRRINFIMPQNVISFSFLLWKLNVMNALSKSHCLIHGIISNDIIVRDINKKELPYSACLHFSIISNS